MLVNGRCPSDLRRGIKKRKKEDGREGEKKGQSEKERS